MCSVDGESMVHHCDASQNHATTTTEPEADGSCRRAEQNGGVNIPISLLYCMTLFVGRGIINHVSDPLGFSAQTVLREALVAPQMPHAKRFGKSILHHS